MILDMSWVMNKTGIFKCICRIKKFIAYRVNVLGIISHADVTTGYFVLQVSYTIEYAFILWNLMTYHITIVKYFCVTRSRFLSSHSASELVLWLHIEAVFIIVGETIWCTRFRGAHGSDDILQLPCKLSMYPHKIRHNVYGSKIVFYDPI